MMSEEAQWNVVQKMDVSIGHCDHKVSRVQRLSPLPFRAEKTGASQRKTLVWIHSPYYEGLTIEKRVAGPAQVPKAAVAKVCSAEL